MNIALKQFADLLRSKEILNSLLSWNLDNRTLVETLVQSREGWNRLLSVNTYVPVLDQLNTAQVYGAAPFTDLLLQITRSEDLSKSFLVSSLVILHSSLVKALSIYSKLENIQQTTAKTASPQQKEDPGDEQYKTNVAG